METFSALLALCAGNSPVTGEFPAQRPMVRRFDVFLDLSLNKQFNKQSWGRWFETSSCSLWRHCNAALLYRLNDNIFGDSGLPHGYHISSSVDFVGELKANTYKLYFVNTECFSIVWFCDIVAIFVFHGKHYGAQEISVFLNYCHSKRHSILI